MDSSESEAVQQLASALAGKYEIVREVGRGAMAVVFQARDVQRDCDVAIKLLDPNKSSSMSRERFLQEVRLCSSVRHPRCMKILDAQEIDGLLYYVMPYFPAESLRNRLTSHGRLSWDTALRTVEEIAEVVGAAHRQGVLHRDLKPENVLITKHGDVVVADFGIAKALHAARADAITVPGYPIGTPGYMSPEQFAGLETVDARTDVFSLGCMLYEMLTGVRVGPWAYAVDSGRKRLPAPPAEKQLIRNLPVPVESILVRALAYEPSQRFRDGVDFAENVNRLRQQATLPRRGVGNRILSFLGFRPPFKY